MISNDLPVWQKQTAKANNESQTVPKNLFRLTRILTEAQSQIDRVGILNMVFHRVRLPPCQIHLVIGICEIICGMRLLPHTLITDIAVSERILVVEVGAMNVGLNAVLALVAS